KSEWVLCHRMGWRECASRPSRNGERCCGVSQKPGPMLPQRAGKTVGKATTRPTLSVRVVRATAGQYQSGKATRTAATASPRTTMARDRIVTLLTTWTSTLWKVSMTDEGTPHPALQ